MNLVKTNNIVHNIQKVKNIEIKYINAIQK